jgi:hypothetical protein
MSVNFGCTGSLKSAQVQTKDNSLCPRKVQICGRFGGQIEPFRAVERAVRRRIWRPAMNCEWFLQYNTRSSYDLAEVRPHQPPRSEFPACSTLVLLIRQTSQRSIGAPLDRSCPRLASEVGHHPRVIENDCGATDATREVKQSRGYRVLPPTFLAMQPVMSMPRVRVRAAIRYACQSTK